MAEKDEAKMDWIVITFLRRFQDALTTKPSNWSYPKQYTRFLFLGLGFGN